MSFQNFRKNGEACPDFSSHKNGGVRNIGGVVLEKGVSLIFILTRRVARIF